MKTYKLGQIFMLDPVLSNEHFIQSFQGWIDYGKSRGILLDYRADEYPGFSPLEISKYLYLIFLNELKRDNQSYERLETDIYTSFANTYPEDLSVRPNLNDRITKAKDSVYLCFPGFVREMMHKNWLQGWKGKKEPIDKKPFYWEIWKLFYFEFLRQGIREDFFKRREIFEKFWPDSFNSRSS